MKEKNVIRIYVYDTNDLVYRCRRRRYNCTSVALTASKAFSRRQQIEANRKRKKRAASSQQHKNAIMNELLHPQMLAYVCEQVAALFHSFVANDMIKRSAYHVNVTCILYKRAKQNS